MSASNAHCTWQLTSGGSWTHVRGRLHGASQCDMPASAGAFVFQHPVDVVFQGDELRGWPRFELELRFLDAHDRSDLAGYAVAHVPTEPGHHVLRCPIWRPRGSLLDRVTAFLLGGYPQLKDPKLRFGVHEDEDPSRLGRAVGDSRLSSCGNGVVHLSIGVCIRHLDPDAQPTGGVAAAAPAPEPAATE
eukprot:2209475-Prymnesium_polylepis.1